MDEHVADGRDGVVDVAALRYPLRGHSVDNLPNHAAQLCRVAGGNEDLHTGHTARRSAQVHRTQIHRW